MSTNEYRRDSVREITIRQEGTTLFIEGADYLPKITDFADKEHVAFLATTAVCTADGFYDLIKGNCNIADPDISEAGHLEMYLALAGFASEIYMKAIIYHENLHGGKMERGHELDKLFEKLPDVIQRKLTSRIDGLKEVLPEIKDMFKTLRYNFELNHVQGRYLVAFPLMEELRVLAHTYQQKKTGTIKCANGVLSFE